MQIRCYLVISESGSVKAYKRMPDPRVGEVVVPLLLQIPNTVFRPRIPQPVSIDVPEQHVAQPVVETFAPPEASDANG